MDRLIIGLIFFLLGIWTGKWIGRRKKRGKVVKIEKELGGRKIKKRKKRKEVLHK